MQKMVIFIEVNEDKLTEFAWKKNLSLPKLIEWIFNKFCGKSVSCWDIDTELEKKIKNVIKTHFYNSL